jgi:KaiC/GvpD/RAD55 family RecA-like ATPase
MVEPNTPFARVRTGIRGLDAMLSGGLYPGRPYIISGPLGSGKTTLCLQFLFEGVKNGESVLYVSIDTPPNEVKFNAGSFGWDLHRIDVLDATSDIRRLEPTPVLDITSKSKISRMSDIPDEIRKTPDFESVVITVHSLQQTLKQITDRTNYTRLVIDSITGLKYFCMEGLDEATAVQSFMRFLSERKITTLLTVELPEAPTNIPPEVFLARGEIRLHKWRVHGELKRGISIELFRGSRHEESISPMEIGKKGIVVYYP